MAKAPAVNRELMSLIVAATNSGGHYFVSEAEGKPLLAHNPALIVVNFEIKEGDKVAAKATDAGKALIMKTTPAAAPAASGEASASPFAIVKGAVLPPSKRGTGLHSGAPKQYPFDEMEVGDSFFVPVSEKHPNPVKTLGSTVSSANLRYAEETGEMKQVTRAVRGPDRKAKVDAEGKKVMETVSIPRHKLTRKFEIREVKAGQKYGEYVAPGDGALIMRVPLPQ